MIDSFQEFKDNTIGYLFKDISIFKQNEDNDAWLINTWVGNEGSNRQLAFDCEELLLAGGRDKFVLQCLYLGVNKNKTFIPFPSYIKNKKDDDTWLWLKGILAQYYKISMREMMLYWDELLYPRLKNEKFKITMATRLGLPNPLRKRLGLKTISFSKKTKIIKGVFDY